ncbi:hypothetical protein BC941DRAFT_457948 [Chlamydoabsidia padenii]|nr:hypothetical protein BC941DRAFT_457948 [Chlamydoabsidia padenii]
MNPDTNSTREDLYMLQKSFINLQNNVNTLQRDVDNNANETKDQLNRIEVTLNKISEKLTDQQEDVPASALITAQISSGEPPLKKGKCVRGSLVHGIETRWNEAQDGEERQDCDPNLLYGQLLTRFL